MRSLTVIPAAAMVLITAMVTECSPNDETTRLSLAEEMKRAVERGGVDAAVARYEELKESHPDDYDYRLEPVLGLAADLFKAQERETAIGMLEAAKQLFVDDVRIYSVLGQFYWYAEDREQCVANFRSALRINPDQKTASRYWDLLFFVPEDFEVPPLMTTDHLRIRPLRAADVDLDYRAVMSSVEHLRGIFGPDDDWPSADLTREDDLRALRNHEKEFERRCAFTYTVMTPDEGECLGCVYIVPTHADEYDAQVYMWVTKGAYDEGLDEELYSAVRKWIQADWPFSRVAYPGRSIGWQEWARLDE